MIDLSVAVVVVLMLPRGQKTHKPKMKNIHVAAVQKSRRIHGNIHGSDQANAPLLNVALTTQMHIANAINTSQGYC